MKTRLAAATSLRSFFSSSSALSVTLSRSIVRSRSIQTSTSSATTHASPRVVRATRVLSAYCQVNRSFGIRELMQSHVLCDSNTNKTHNNTKDNVPDHNLRHAQLPETPAHAQHGSNAPSPVVVANSSFTTGSNVVDAFITTVIGLSMGVPLSSKLRGTTNNHA